MPSELARKLLTVLMLGALTASAFFIRLENFKNSPNRSIDEIVYYRMGKQVLRDGLAGYNTIPYGRELSAQGRPLPDYFFQPVFKYPPLFSLLITQSMRMFGKTVVAAGYVSLLAGVLLIPLVYLLGALVGNRFVGALSAFLMFMDPVAIICSQKIWPETTLALFTLLSVLCFVQTIKQKKYSFFLLSGICCGLATLTKYPEILLVGAYSLYAAIWRKDLFANKFFLAGLATPPLMLVPWILWNVQVYGWRWFPMQIGLHSSPLHQKELLLKITVTLVVMAGVFFWLFFRGGKKRLQQYIDHRERAGDSAILRLLGLGLAVILWENLWRGFDLTALPEVGWSSGMFYYAPATFYLGRLLEFSLIYGFGYAVFFLPAKTINKEIQVVKIVSTGLMLFYIFWGNYQSRYILSAIPFFLVLAAYGVHWTMTRILQQPRALRRNVLLTLFILVIIYAFVKTSYINANISFPNDLCYF
jgi:4-amino-4-deoxy-L-arabinose transferase-like glycosyltransferase